MCKCIDIEIGSHETQITLLAPSWSSKKYIAVDACLKEEILFLWKNGVITDNSCCGHNKISGFIIVAKESEKIMKALGYKSFVNEFGVICYYSAD